MSATSFNMQTFSQVDFDTNPMSPLPQVSSVDYIFNLVVGSSVLNDLFSTASYDTSGNVTLIFNSANVCSALSHDGYLVTANGGGVFDGGNIDRTGSDATSAYFSDLVTPNKSFGELVAQMMTFRMYGVLDTNLLLNSGSLFYDSSGSSGFPYQVYSALDDTYNINSATTGASDLANLYELLLSKDRATSGVASDITFMNSDVLTFPLNLSGTVKSGISTVTTIQDNSVDGLTRIVGGKYNGDTSSKKIPILLKFTVSS